MTAPEGCTRRTLGRNRCETEERHACRDGGVAATALATGAAAAGWSRVRRPRSKPKDRCDGQRLRRIGSRRRSMMWRVERVGRRWRSGSGLTDQRPLAMRWDGKASKATVQPVKTDAALESVAVGTATIVWAVGEDLTDPSKTLALHWNGTKWQAVKPPAVLSANNAWLPATAPTTAVRPSPGLQRAPHRHRHHQGPNLDSRHDSHLHHRPGRPCPLNGH